MLNRSLGHRAPLLWIVLPFILGLAAAKSFTLGPVILQLAIALTMAVAAIFAARRALRLWAPAVVVAMFFAGTASYQLHRVRLSAWEALPPREARLAVQVDRVFAQADTRRASGLGRIVETGDHLGDLVGQRVYFSLTLRKGETAPIRSSVITAVGVLMTLPRDPPADSFDGYLAGAGTNFRLTRGRMVAEERPAHPYYRFCARAAARCHHILGLGIAEKRPALAGLLRAMMLGAANELSEEQHTLFMQSGTMHLFAISGLNIGVIAGALQAILLLLRLPPWLRFVIGTCLLWLFVDITGAAPSAVRAFVMSVFLQAAFVLQRPGNLVAALVASAFIVVLVSPLQIFSASFLMSYGIVLALLVLGLPLGEAWLERWKPWRDLPKPAWHWTQHVIEYLWRTSTAAIAVGLATTLVGWLTGLQFFSLLTPGALLANLVLIPAAVVVTLGGFTSLVCGLVGLGVGAIVCNHAAALVLLIIEGLVRLSVKLPGAFLPARYSHSWIGPVAFALIITALLFGYATGWSTRRGGWWPPFAIVAMVLIFGVTYG